MIRKVLIAPNAFKGTLSAKEAAAIISDVFSKELPEVRLDSCPIADGGDGTCELIAEYLGLAGTPMWSLNAIGLPKAGKYFLNKNSREAYIDVSEVSGLGNLNPTHIEPTIASSFGTGLLIKEAIQQGAGTIILGLGGSATIDLGLGILQALGFVFLSESGRELKPFSKDFIFKIAHIQRPLQLPDLKFSFICDVKSKFRGESGAIRSFGPQKGIKPKQIPRWEEAAEYVISLLKAKSGKELEDIEGFGAAGGIAYGLSHFFDTQIKEGSGYFFEKIQMTSRIQASDLIITGEGRFDQQSSDGKGPYELGLLAKQSNKPISLISSGRGGFDSFFDEYIQLNELDFNREGFKDLAINNLDMATKQLIEELKKKGKL